MQVAVREAALQELRDTILGFFETKVIPLRELRSFAGKANHVATLVYTWRPFLGEI